MGQVCKQIGVTEQTYYRWRKEYGGLRLNQAKRLKVLEKENARLKKLVADRGGPHRLDHLAAFLRWTPQFLLPPVRGILRGGEPEGKVPLRMFFQASVHLLRRRPSVRRVRSLAVV